MSSIFSANVFSAKKPDFTAVRAKLFEKADKDKSGGLSLDEFMPGGQEVPGKNDTPATSASGLEKKKALFAKIDTNGDGSLSKDELNAYDSKVTADLQDAMTKLQEALQGTQARRKKHGHHLALSEMFDKADTSKDGSLSLDEVKAALGGENRTFAVEKSGKIEKLFAKIDTNGDSLLSKAEVKAFEDARKAHHHGDVAGNPSIPDTGAKPGEDVQFSVLMQALNAYGKGKRTPMPWTPAADKTSAATAVTA